MSIDLSVVRFRSWQTEDAYHPISVLPGDPGGDPDFEPPGPDLDPPVLAYAFVDENELSIVFNETLDPNSVPDPTDFTLLANAAPRSIGSVVIDGNTARLTLSSPVFEGQSVTFTYTAGTSPIQDLYANEAADITTTSATNETGDPPPSGTSYPDAFFVGQYESGTLPGTWPGGWDLNGISTVVAAPGMPIGGFTKCMKCIVDDTFGNSVTGNVNYVQRHPGDSWEKNGSDTWYRYAVLLPDGTDPNYPGVFHVQPGVGWNMLQEFHEYQCAPGSSFLGVSPSTNPDFTQTRFRFRWIGYPDTWVDQPVGSSNIQANTWYEFKLHVKWSLSGAGMVNLFINDILSFSLTGKTLHTKVDGETTGYVHNQLGHYRGSPSRVVHVPDYIDVTYHSPMIIGPSLASVMGV